jgi:sialate O-acetylesterase
MAFSIPSITNSSYEAALADQYSGPAGIRLFTVGQGTTRVPVPADHLHSLEQPWAVASKTTVAIGNTFGVFSAVCWVFGRTVHDGLGGTVPVGLISNNWPGTTVEDWSTTASVQQCTQKQQHVGNLFDGMINPFTVGPMALTGFTWYQGESNVGADNITTGKNDFAAAYSCIFPSMITEWRTRFKSPSTYFGFVQLATWCNTLSENGIAPMRGQIIEAGIEAEGQMAALNLKNVGYATNADHGTVRVSDRNLHSRIPLNLTPLLRLKRCHACDQCHSSLVSTPQTG